MQFLSLLVTATLGLQAAPAPPCRPATSSSTDAVDRLAAVVNIGRPDTIRAYVASGAVVGGSSEERERWLSHLGLEHWRSRRWHIEAVCSAADSGVVALVRNELTFETDSLTIALAPGSASIRRLVVSTGVRVHLSAADTVSDLARTEALDRYVERLADAGVFSGVVLVDKDGETLYSRAVGRMNESRVNTLATRFNLASLNKLFTATAILQLVAAGKLDLGDSLGAVLPDSVTPRGVGRIRIEHLLSHTSGIAASGDSLVAEPGTVYSYSNTGYGLLGDVIETLSGERYEDYLEEHIYRQAGMRCTGRFVLSRPVEHLAMGYVPSFDDTGLVLPENPLLHTIPGNSIGGLFSNVEDLRAFALALRLGRLVPEELVTTMYTPKTELGAPQYGYGVVLWRGTGVWGHAGDLPGTDADLEILPSAGLVSVVLSNYSGVNDPIRRRIAHLWGVRSR